MLGDKIGRPIFAWQTTDFRWLIILADKIGQLHRSFKIPFMYNVQAWNTTALCLGPDGRIQYQSRG